MLRKLGGHLRNQWAGFTALFLVLCGGTALAVDGPNPGQNTVGSEDIIGNEVNSGDIANGKIFNLDIADEIIQSGKIKNGTLTELDVAPDALGDAAINQGSLGLARGRTMFGQTRQDADSIGSVYQIDDRITMLYHCPANPLSQDGAVSFINPSGTPVKVFVDDGSANPVASTISAGGQAQNSTNPLGDRIVYTFWADTGEEGTFGTVVFDSNGEAGDGGETPPKCYTQVQAYLSE